MDISNVLSSKDRLMSSEAHQLSVVGTLTSEGWISQTRTK